MSYNPTNPFPPLMDRNERTIPAVPVNRQWIAGLPSGVVPGARNGACVGQDPDVMFPEDDDRAGIVRAKKLCDACPIQASCLDAAMSRRDVHGIWGGTTEHDRRRIRGNKWQRQYRAGRAKP